MSLQRKTLIIAGVTALALAVTLYAATRAVLLQSFRQLEESDARQNLERVLSAIDDDVATLDRTCRDAARWDKAYAFVANRNAEFVKSDIGYGAFSTLAERRLNILLYVNADGRIFFGEGFDLRAMRETPIPEGIQPHVQ